MNEQSHQINNPVKKQWFSDLMISWSDCPSFLHFQYTQTTLQFRCGHEDIARMYLQLPLQLWDEALVLFCWKVNIAKNLIAVMGL